ncbi:MAG: type I 3-dehydroquinate dehydratase [Phycisphaerales bacterium]
MTLVCVPIFVEDIDAALRDAVAARDAGADLVEWRIDTYFSGSTGSDTEDGVVVAELQRLLAESPLPAILTCRPTWEGGDYDGDDADRVALFEKLCTGESAPAYLDVELAAYTRSANIRQKIDLCVNHPKQIRDVRTKLILSIHDFKKRPDNLDRRLLEAYDAPACAVVKVAYRARSLRDNLDLFELTRGSPKPTIALGMGEFGLMSRVLAPKFGGYLTFASLRDSSGTAPGQPTVDELLNLYRFRSIGRETRIYGVIGWPVGHSLSPHVHNAGFEAVGHDGVYLPLPIAADENDAEASYLSFKTTVWALFRSEPILLAGASVTIPFKECLARMGDGIGQSGALIDVVDACGAANTIDVEINDWSAIPPFYSGHRVANTDAIAIEALARGDANSLAGSTVCLVGAGGVARAAAWICMDRGARVLVNNRSEQRALELVDGLRSRRDSSWEGDLGLISAQELIESQFDVYINCTPVGMKGGPDPDGLSIPVPDMPNVGPDTVFFDTVYNPVETPMLKAARERGCTTIDGVEMFVRQAAAQFELWTGKPAPVQLFDRICREKLASS